MAQIKKVKEKSKKVTSPSVGKVKPETMPEIKKDTRAGKMILLVVITLFAGLVGYAYYAYRDDGLSDDIPNEVTSEEVVAPENNEVTELLKQLNNRLDKLEKNSISLSDYQDYNAKVSQRMDEIEKYNKNNRGEASVLLTAVMVLHQALNSSNSFVTELNALKSIGGQNRIISSFVQDFEFRSKVGIRTYAEISDDFEKVKFETMRDYLTPSTENFWGKVWYNILPSIKIYKVRSSEKNNTLPNLLVKVEENLKLREYNAALEHAREIENIDVKTYAKLRLFIKDLQDRQDIIRRLSEITAYALELAERGK
jgi:hypothetical protein